MRNIILALAALCFVDVTMTKELKPDCNPRIQIAQLCETDDECKFSDELCQNGYCTVQASIYAAVTCQQGQKQLYPYCGMKTMMIRNCQNDFDCGFSDEFCEPTEKYCKTDMSLYEDYDCYEDMVDTIASIAQQSDEEKLAALRARQCMMVKCTPDTQCVDGVCVKN